MKNIHRGREHVENAGRLSSPLSSPTVQYISRQAAIIDTLRLKHTTKTYLSSLIPHFLNPFCLRELRRQIVLGNARITLNPDLFQRKADR